MSCITHLCLPFSNFKLIKQVYCHCYNLNLSPTSHELGDALLLRCWSTLFLQEYNMPPSCCLAPAGCCINSCHAALSSSHRAAPSSSHCPLTALPSCCLIALAGCCAASCRTALSLSSPCTALSLSCSSWLLRQLSLCCPLILS